MDDEQPTTPAVIVEPIAYRASCLPAATPNARHWTLKVEWRGLDRWAVIDSMAVLAVDGAWDDEPSPSNRDDSWTATHYYDLDTALQLAREKAPLMNINGMTPADVLARLERNADVAP